MQDVLTFYLNGEKKIVTPEQSGIILSDYLRYELCQTGTKVVCAEGDCGACTVLRYFPDPTDDKGDDKGNAPFLPVNSCILPLAALHGSHLLTVEALENKKTEKLHECQRAIVDLHASQCGFCTPGFVMSLAGLCENKKSQNRNPEESITPKEAQNAMTGNLCRCTGYQSLIDAATSIELSKVESLRARYHTTAVEADLRAVVARPLLLKTPDFHFFAPKTWEEAVAFFGKHPEAKILASGTDLGVVNNKRKLRLSHLLSLHLIPDVKTIVEDSGSITVGAKVSLSEFRNFLQQRLPEYARYLDLFASPQIKNIASLVGNIANASPIGDNAPVLLALDAQLELYSSAGSRLIELKDFFLDYRKVALNKGELIRRVHFQLPKSKNFFRLFKNSIRKDLDISTLNLACHLEGEKGRVQKIRLAAGGIAAIPLRLKKTEGHLTGKTIDNKTIAEAVALAQTEFTPLSDVRASASYRRVVLGNLLTRSLREFAEAKA